MWATAKPVQTTLSLREKRNFNVNFYFYFFKETASLAFLGCSSPEQKKKTTVNLKPSCCADVDDSPGQLVVNDSRLFFLHVLLISVLVS